MYRTYIVYISITYVIVHSIYKNMTCAFLYIVLYVYMYVYIYITTIINFTILFMTCFYLPHTRPHTDAVDAGTIIQMYIYNRLYIHDVKFTIYNI